MGWRRSRSSEPHADLRLLIERFGWAVEHVRVPRRSTGTPSSYTVGLTAAGHPEIVVLGLPAPVAQDFLNAVAEQVRAGGSYRPGQRTGEFTDEDGPVVFLRVEDTGGLASARDVYGSVEALQLVWPDSTGRLPWQPGYRNAPGVQPLLGQVP
ncbi:uncharacterized protein DUF4262 [Blastococcus colisei]|uniref:Uncharacterized protein DUF4262 n=1 Tax=Blastococcus colisei TaxID=1564162 RepID=A0A543PCQ6_9ACTN|nr:DUF4262 domain-containing protein [Blastococcus colisei]TQN41864.1 uncharacterized protein DUF4262 [Blastococcus colisei]